MSSIKITELTEATQLNSNTAKNLVITVDLVTGLTNKMTVKNLAASIYSNNSLVVSKSITSNTITSNTLTSNVVISNTTTSNTITSNTLTSNVVISNIITSNSITSNVIRSNIITSNSITSNVVTSNTIIANNAITSNIVTSNTITSNVVTFNIVTSNTITSNLITINAITSNTIVSNTVTSNIVTFNIVTSNTTTSNVINSNTLTSNIIVSNTITSNTITVTQSNVVNLFVTQANVANLTLVSGGTFQLGQVDYLDATNTRTSYQPNFTKISLLTNADLNLDGLTNASDTVGLLKILTGTSNTSTYLGWQPSLQLANNKTTGISFFKSAFSNQAVGAASEGFLTLTSGNILTANISNYIRVGQYSNISGSYNSPSIVLKPNTSSPWTAGVGIGGEPGDTGISSNTNTSGSLVVYGGTGVTGNVYVGGIIVANSGSSFGVTLGVNPTDSAAQILAGSGVAPMQFAASSFRNYVSGFTRSYLDSNALTLGLQSLPMDSSTANTNGGLLVYGGAGITGNVYTGGVVSPGKGLVYLPLVYPGAQTAITLDFANNSLVRANTSSGVTVSFSNFNVGKTVDLWITNTSGGSVTFTHGCSSLGSTVGATTYTIPATSSICASYVSFGTDVANTFVAITK